MDISLRAQLATAASLTPFGVEFRYPGEQVADFEAARRAVEEARRVRGVVLSRLQDYLNQGRPGTRGSGV